MLITGASSGIGEITAKKIGRLGMTVILLSRSKNKLKVITEEIVNNGGNAEYLYLDVSSFSNFKSVIEYIKNKYGRVDILINNAGVMLLSEINELKVDEWDQMIDVNFKGVLNGVASVLSIMRKQKSGLIINVISTAAYRVMEGSSVYSATKSAIKTFSEGLRKEEANNGIKVSLIAPGPTKTDLLTHTSSRQLSDSLVDFVDSHGLNVSDVANTIVYQLTVNDNVSIDEVVISTSRKMNKG
ncbi:SDR family oxidoreductase [Tetragenococcus halophilus]|uniref:SDR family oxidoreductase n=1 Tax=Tetragenococcus halophilus TaxID=51669 RepID=UPI00209BA857